MLDEWFSTRALPGKNRAPHGPAHPRSREACGTNTSGISTGPLPPTCAPRPRLTPVTGVMLAASGCPAAGEPPRCPVALTPTRGFRGAAAAFGVSPWVTATRAARCRASPGDRALSSRSGHAASGSPDPAIGLAPDVFPVTDLRRPARGSRTDGASGSLAFASTVMTLGSPWPSRSLHRVDSSAFSGARVPCPRVLLSCSTIPTRAGIVFVVIVPTGLADRSVVQTLGRSPRFPATPAFEARRTMSPSSFQRSPLHCLGSRGVHVPRSRRRARFGDRSPTRLVHRLRGFAPP